MAKKEERRGIKPPDEEIEATVFDFLTKTPDLSDDQVIKYSNERFQKNHAIQKQIQDHKTVKIDILEMKYRDICQKVRIKIKQQ